MFLIGTTGISDNEIHLVDFDEDTMKVSSTILSHPFEISEMTTHPDHLPYVLTASRNEKRDKFVGLYQINDVDFGASLDDKAGSLEQKMVIHPNSIPEMSSSTEFTGFHWSTDNCLILTQNEILNFSLSNEQLLFKKRIIHEDGLENNKRLRKCVSNPHHAHDFAYCFHHTVQGYDMKSNKKTFNISHAHVEKVLDIDYNPNKMNQIATAGQDGRIKIWDLRQYDKPVLEMSHHSHWVTSVSYNKFHDQLLLSSSTDTLVHLFSIVSVSSAPTRPAASDFGDLETSDRFQDDDMMEQSGVSSALRIGGLASRTSGSVKVPSRFSSDDDDEHEGNYPIDGIVTTIDQHEDSVYAAQWSASDPWIFASMSVDGRVMFNFVPKEHKYKIIL